MSLARLLPVAGAMILAGIGCARVAIEGGDKPIHIVMDVNVRVEQSLHEFFAFEDKIPTTTSRPASANAVSRLEEGAAQ